MTVLPPIHELLAVRAQTHGDYSHHARYTQDLKRCLRAGAAWEGLTDTEREALEVICHKIGRIMAGNPHFRDHWQDIAGYAQLVADRCPPG